MGGGGGSPPPLLPRSKLDPTVWQRGSGALHACMCCCQFACLGHAAYTQLCLSLNCTDPTTYLGCRRGGALRAGSTTRREVLQAAVCSRYSGDGNAAAAAAAAAAVVAPSQQVVPHHLIIIICKGVVAARRRRGRGRALVCAGPATSPHPPLSLSTAAQAYNIPQPHAGTCTAAAYKHRHATRPHAVHVPAGHFQSVLATRSWAPTSPVVLTEHL